ncbi:unnamed protein product, partial [Amoebophrya sp. A25]|eukprot:GSA25T00023023001.1
MDYIEAPPPPELDPEEMDVVANMQEEPSPSLQEDVRQENPSGMGSGGRHENK